MSDPGQGEGTDGDRRLEPKRPPDLWLPPTATDASSPPATWRQPPGWQEPPAGWQQPPAAPGPSRPTRPLPAYTMPAYGPPATPSWPSTVLRLRRGRRSIVNLVAALAIAPLVVLVVVSLVFTAVVGRQSSPSRSGPPRSTSTIASAWDLTPTQLRPDLAEPAYLSTMDGTFDDAYVAEVAGTWLTMTGTQEDGSIELHGIDPQTGAVRWQRSLDGGLCTAEAPKSGLVLCASVLERDQTTTLGTRWQLHLLDPATGADRVTRDVDGWFTGVHWSGTSFVALEQREPAPHAVVRAFRASDLHDLWTRDLSGEPGQADLFSEDKIINREDPRPGIALDRPRFRDVGSGLLALWAGQRTAFIDAEDGRLVFMPHCSRLVDDGHRLWCNEVDGASAYSYAGKLLVRVHGPRLAYPEDDGRGVDRNRPVFLDDDGAGVNVNPTTGDVGATYTPPGRGSAFGNETMPSSATVGDRTFLVGGAGAMLLDPDHDRVDWRNPAITLTDVPVPLGQDTMLLGAGRLYAVDLATGGAGPEQRAPTTYAVAVGDRVAGVGLDQLSLLKP